MTRPVAVIGVFDGVHQGHRALISAARSEAGARPVLALTFDPHPQAIVGRGAPSSLATIDYRIELLHEAGANDVGVLHFDRAMAALGPEEFVDNVLVSEYAVGDIVVGENFRFGARAAGDVSVLKQLGAARGIGVHSLSLIGDDAGRWSSTRIRELIVAGDVVSAAEGLARPYRIDGVIEHGAGRGRDLGYPTANLRWDQSATVPGDGVYAGRVRESGHSHQAAISIGTNPQFDGQSRTIEAYVLDRDDLDLYGAHVQFTFARRLRAQQRFADVDGLRAQMARDVQAAREALGAP